MKYVIYYRVSTKGQGESGLGLEAQKRDVELFLTQFADTPYEVLAEFTDIASGKDNYRDGFTKAVALAKKAKAKLLVAKLDRISRRVVTIAAVMEQVEIKVAAMPVAGNFELHIYAALAEQERVFISARTKAALQSITDNNTRLRAEGVTEDETDENGKTLIRKLGGNRGNIDRANAAATAKAVNDAQGYRGQIERVMKTGINDYKGIATMLNEFNVKTVRGGTFQGVQVKRLMDKLGMKLA